MTGRTGPAQIVVAGVIVHNNRLLAAQRRSNTQDEGLWEFPGGKREPGETDTQALVRELQEELGVTVSVGRLLGTSPIDSAQRPMTLHAYACTVLRGTPQALEHNQLRWLGPNQLEDQHWCPADQRLLGAAAGVLGSSSGPPEKDGR